MFSQAIVAIDGSKFKAVNARDKNFTPNKVRKRQEQIEESIKRYLDALDTADRTQGPAEFKAKAERLQDKLKTMREQMRRMNQIEQRLKAKPAGQLSLTDRDARSMATSGRGSGIVGYNVQVAVDAKHHLIATHEVTNEGSDRAQLSPMAAAARQAMGKEKLLAIADRGYFSGPQIKKCHDAGNFSSRHSSTKRRQTFRMPAPLSRRKSAIVLKSGARRPVSHISSTLRLHSRSRHRLD